MVVGQLLQRGQTVVSKNIPAVAFNGKLFFVDNGIRTALFKSLGSKGVAVERFAFQRKENRTFGAVAAVGGNLWMLGEDSV